MKSWFVFYTKSRQEKKIEEYLIKRGYEVFLPIQKVLRQWSDRKKKVEVPLFNSYIFVYETEDKIPTILQTPGIAWNIRHNNKPAVLHPKEYDLIKLFLDSGLFIESGTAEDFEAGDGVKIIDGPLKGLSGKVLKSTERNRFAILLESIGQSLIVTLDPIVLKKI